MATCALQTLPTILASHGQSLARQCAQQHIMLIALINVCCCNWLLQELYLDGNQLNTIPESLARVEHLRRL